MDPKEISKAVNSLEMFVFKKCNYILVRRPGGNN